MPVRAQPSGESLAPADVGYYMDVLQGRLKQAMGNIGIGRQGDRIALDLTGRMTFAPGSTQPSAGNHAILASLSKVLVEYRMTLVSVRVRADDPATHAIDARLSEQRAQAIANDLAAAGVGLKRIVIAGVGEDKRAHVELSLEPIVSPAGNGR
jgi:outer membrane protein OmpA-like peptidoglycan-associated protein